MLDSAPSKRLSSPIRLMSPNLRRRSLLTALSAAVGGGVALSPGAARAQLKLDVPFAPTNFTLIDTMLRVANVGPGDFVIDLGPEGGAAGGAIVAEGTPEEIARVAESHTGRALAGMLGA